MSRWPRLSRPGLVLVLGAAGVAALGLLVEVDAPADVGTMAPVGLDGRSLDAVVPTSAGMVVGGHTGAYLVYGEAQVREFGIDASVHDLLARDDVVLAATDSGVWAIDRQTGEIEDRGPGVRVDVLADGPNGLLALADGALMRRAVGESWETLLETGVRTVAVVDGEVLVGRVDGLARLGPADEPEILLAGPPIDLVAGVDLGDRSRIFAASRERPRLWAAPAAEGPWEPSDQGLRLATVETVVADPGRQGRVLAGGTGLADGEQTAGVIESDDGGRTWRDREDRLANVHVNDLTVRAEPLRAQLSLAGAHVAAIPVTPPRPRVYAATNGAGLYSRQAALPFADAGALPLTRVLGPVVLGALALAAAWRAFGALRPARREPTKGRGWRAPQEPAARQDPMRLQVRRAKEVEPE